MYKCDCERGQDPTLRKDITIYLGYCQFCAKELRKQEDDFGSRWNSRMDELGAKRGTIEDLQGI